jgi:hypothetical protein
LQKTQLHYDPLILLLLEKIVEGTPYNTTPKQPILKNSIYDFIYNGTIQKYFDKNGAIYDIDLFKEVKSDFDFADYSWFRILDTHTESEAPTPEWFSLRISFADRMEHVHNLTSYDVKDIEKIINVTRCLNYGVDPFGNDFYSDFFETYEEEFQYSPKKDYSVLSREYTRWSEKNLRQYVYIYFK